MSPDKEDEISDDADDAISQGFLYYVINSDEDYNYD